MLIHRRIYFTRNLSSQAKNKRVLRVATRHSVAIKHLLRKYCKSLLSLGKFLQDTSFEPQSIKIAVRVFYSPITRKISPLK